MVATTRSSQGQRGRASRRPASSRRSALPEKDGALRYLVDFLDAFMWRADPETLRFTFVTRTAEQLLGHRLERWLGGPECWGELLHADDRERVVAELRAAAADGGDREIEFRATKADGRTVWLRHAVRTVASSSRESASELWGLTTDITASKEAEAALRRTSERYRAMSAKAERFRQQALHDALTELPNRILFEDRLAQAILEAEREGGRCAVLLVDLDRFKQINDTRGHQAGDDVLRQVALRFRVALRRPDTAARIGGDEFAAVMPGADAAGAVRAAERIVHAMSEPCSLENGPLAVGASIGIAVYPAHGTDGAELLRRADDAMYIAKKTGGGYSVSASTVSDSHVPKARAGGWKRWTVVFAVVALGLSSWAYAAVSGSSRSRSTVAAQLSGVAATLANAKGNEQAVVAALSTAERTLDTMSWDQVRGTDLLKSLTLLHRGLVGIDLHLTGAIRQRVRQLTLNVEQAEAAARLKTQPSRPVVNAKTQN